MTIRKIMGVTVILMSVFTTNAAFAYSEEMEKPICKAPKIRDFNLPVYSAQEKNAVAPESELMFTISNWTDPETISVTAKGVPLQIHVEDKKSFFRVTATLPAQLNGKFVRINAKANAVLGCKGEDGWLVKVADKQDASVTSEAPSSESTVEKPEVAVDATETAKSEPKTSESTDAQ
ncbi:MAG: hypothetical protein Kow0065_05140 [Methylomicrobium sp.]